MSPRLYLLAAFALPAVTLPAPGCAESSDPSPRLALTVAPLDLPGVADACYSIAVHNVARTLVNADALVWSEADLCASRFGNDTGSITYIGTCDASPSGRINTVSLVLEGLCETTGCDVADTGDTGRIAPDTYVNPCPANRPCQLERPCNANADTLVEFNLTIMRDASQGFFDIAVNFEDIFCSAKLDCVPELLHRPGGERDLTAVLAFACTSGAAETCLYANRVTLDCGGANVWTIDPSAGPGNITESSPLLFAAATYKGDEAFTDFQKSYWNVALGLDETLFATYPNCTLRWTTTASEDPLVGQTTPFETTYPVIGWERQIVTNGALTCGSHPLNGVLAGEPRASVATRYTEVDAPEAFVFSNCEPDETLACNCPEGFSPNAAETLCERVLTTAPTNQGASYGICAGYSNASVGYSSEGARFTTSNDPTVFEYVSFENPGCAFGATCLPHDTNSVAWNGRLARVGLWACQPGGSDPLQMTPFNAWIGFSKCLTLAAGVYLVGVAGDNDVLLRINGAVVYRNVSPQSFQVWNVLRLELDAGTHTIELYGRNSDAVAAFGAELAGPFPAGTLTLPFQMANADYLGNIVFSTASMRTGSTEQLQTLTGDPMGGFVCPTNYALDLCGAAPVCTHSGPADVACLPR